MRDISQDDKGGMSWPRPTQQKADVRVFKSTERPSLSAAFGTSSPPSGLSGLLRRWAFTKSEGKWGHWLILLFADRVNVVEGIFHDLLHFRIPNIPMEMGLRAELRHNRSRFLRKAAILLLLIAIIAALSLADF